MSACGGGLSEAYGRWVESQRGLAGIARLIHDRGEEGRAEAMDLYARLGELLGVGGRGGERVRERPQRCSGARAKTCQTCLTTFGHGPYLEMRVRGEDKKWRWVRVEETLPQRQRRRDAYLVRWLDQNRSEALKLLGEVREARAGGFLVGSEAEAAEAKIRAALNP